MIIIHFRHTYVGKCFLSANDILESIVSYFLLDIWTALYKHSFVLTWNPSIRNQNLWFTPMYIFPLRDTK